MTGRNTIPNIKELANDVLVTVYMGTENSSNETRQRAATYVCLGYIVSWMYCVMDVLCHGCIVARPTIIFHNYFLQGFPLRRSST